MTGDVGRQKNNIGIKGCKNRVAEGCCHGAFLGQAGGASLAGSTVLVPPLALQGVGLRLMELGKMRPKAHK